MLKFNNWPTEIRLKGMDHVYFIMSGCQTGFELDVKKLEINYIFSTFSLLPCIVLIIFLSITLGQYRKWYILLLDRY